MTVFYTWLQGWNANLQQSNINMSSGKAVFSGTLEEGTQLACVVSVGGGGVWGIMTFQRE